MILRDRALPRGSFRPAGRFRLALGLGVVALAAATGVGAATFGANEVVIQDPVAEDLYVAARTIQVGASVDGDAVLAAGQVQLYGDVTGDVIAAGGEVTIDGGVGDDLRAAGGRVTVSGFVTDHAVITGGTVTLTPASAIAGRVWIAGGDASIGGQLGGGLRVAAGTVVISGQIEGDVDVRAGELRLLPGTIIGGDLIWRGEGEPEISEEAQIFGEIRKASAADGEPGDVAADSGPRWWSQIVAALALYVAAAGLWWLLPGLAQRAGRYLRQAPGRAVLLGLVAVPLVPVAIVLLFASVIGWLLALLLLLGYLLALVMAGLLGLVAVADAVGPRTVTVPASGRPDGRRLLILLLIAVGVVLLRAVPVAGVAVSIALVLAGLGAMLASFRNDAVPA